MILFQPLIFIASLFRDQGSFASFHSEVHYV